MLPRKQLAEPYRFASTEITPTAGVTQYRLPWLPCGDVQVFIGGLPMLKANYAVQCVGDECFLNVTEPIFFDGEVMLVTALI